MNFEVNGRRYFLNFVPAEGQWILFTPAADGITRIPVVSDFHLDRFVMPPAVDHDIKAA